MERSRPARAPYECAHERDRAARTRETGRGRAEGGSSGGGGSATAGGQAITRRGSVRGAMSGAHDGTAWRAAEMGESRWGDPRSGANRLRQTKRGIVMGRRGEPRRPNDGGKRQNRSRFAQRAKYVVARF